MRGWECPVDFNSIELKFYLGKNAFDGIETGDGNYLKLNSNKKIGQHVDCKFVFGDQNKCKQASLDTAMGNHPIATLSIGEMRELTFFEQKKQKKGRWEKKNALPIKSFHLDHNSLFVLIPWEDEIPRSRTDGFLSRKTHQAEFNGDHLSVAMVFRKVKDNCVDLFEEKSGTWIFNQTSAAANFLCQHRREFDKIRAMSRDYLSSA